MGYLRLRQICLVAKELAPVEKQIIDVLGLEVCFRDTGVAKYGLHNALFAMSGTFLEVVAPTEPNTAAGRYIERRKGDGGYMYIVDCDDLEHRREHFKKMNLRMVEDLNSPADYATGEAIHLHPRDTGGCLLSIDRHSPNPDMKGSYKWAGPDWHKHDHSKVMTAIIGADMQSEDPEALAERWSEILERPVKREREEPEIQLDNAFVRFGRVRDDRGEGMRSVHLKCKDKAHVMAAAKKAGLHAGPEHVELCGVRFVLA